MVVGIVANAALAFFAVAAWFRLHNVDKKMSAVLRGVSMVSTLTMGQYVKGAFEELERMRATMERLVEEDRFEEAKRLKDIIDKAEHDAKQSLEKFKEIGGDLVKFVEVKVEEEEE